MSLEAHITNQCRDYFKALAIKHKDFYEQKFSDRFTSAIPDWYILWRAQSFWIELKRPGEVSTPLQEYTLRQLSKAGALTLSTDNFEDVKELIESFSDTLK